VCRGYRLRQFLQLQEKLLKVGESPNQALFPIFVGYLRGLYSEGVTRCGTRQLQ